MDLPNLGIEPGSPALQVDSFFFFFAGGFFTNELSEKPLGGKGLPKNIRALKKVMVV